MPVSVIVSMANLPLAACAVSTEMLMVPFSGMASSAFSMNCMRSCCSWFWFARIGAGSRAGSTVMSKPSLRRRFSIMSTWWLERILFRSQMSLSSSSARGEAHQLFGDVLDPSHLMVQGVDIAGHRAPVFQIVVHEVQVHHHLVDAVLQLRRHARMRVSPGRKAFPPRIRGW